MEEGPRRHRRPLRVRDPGTADAGGDLTDLAEFLAAHPPFDGLAPEARARIAAAARVLEYSAGDLVLDAFAGPTTDVYVVVTGQVDVWNDADGTGEAADERLEPGGVFGFSAMLTERSIGPRAVAATASTVAELPAEVVGPVFGSAAGARFLAEQLATAGLRAAALPTYSAVDELVVRPPLLVAPSTPIAETARRMTERDLPYAAVALGDGRYGLVTDTVLRERVVLGDVAAGAPVETVMMTAVPSVRAGDSAAEALITLLDTGADLLLVRDEAGGLLGVVAPRDFAVSPTTAGVSLHEQLRRAESDDELVTRARGIPAALDDLLSRGLSSGKTIAVYSSMLDTVVRRALVLVFRRHPELSVDGFTWLSLGSNGRREAVLSSDVDSAVAFEDGMTERDILAYLPAFGEVDRLLRRAGLGVDRHGATAENRLFARTNAEWRAAGEQWLASPEENKGAVMTSLLVDGRPIHGDPGLPAVTRLFGDLREHPGTMRLLLRESLSKRARLRSMRAVLTKRADTFDIKAGAVVPVVNIARWAGLSVGSRALATTERLRAAAGSTMLPEEQASSLVEAFEVLQRLRLRYQLLDRARGCRPSDVLGLDRVSPIDRSVIERAVREIGGIQRRMANVAAYVDLEDWVAPT